MTDMSIDRNEKLIDTHTLSIAIDTLSNIAIVGTGRHLTAEACLDTLHRSEAIADSKGYFGCYLNENCRFLGTDCKENWSITQFIEYSKEAFKKTSAWDYSLIPGTRKCFEIVENQVIIFDELLLAKSFKCTARGSGNLVKSNGYWFITQYHLSFPTPNDIAYDICKQIEKYEKQLISAKLADNVASELLKELELEEEKNAKKSNNDKTKNKSKKK